MIVPHSWWGNKDIMYTEVKRAALLFFQMKNLTSPICFLIVRKCWEIHLQWVCSKSWASKVFFITCFFSTRFFIFHVFFQFQKVFLSHIWKKKHVRTTWKWKNNKSGHQITCQCLHFCPLTLSIPIQHFTVCAWQGVFFTLGNSILHCHLKLLLHVF